MNYETTKNAFNNLATHYTFGPPVFVIEYINSESHDSKMLARTQFVDNLLTIDNNYMSLILWYFLKSRSESFTVTKNERVMTVGHLLHVFRYPIYAQLREKYALEKTFIIKEIWNTASSMIGKTFHDSSTLVSIANKNKNPTDTIIQSALVSIANKNKNPTNTIIQSALKLYLDNSYDCVTAVGYVKTILDQIIKNPGILKDVSSEGLQQEVAIIVLDCINIKGSDSVDRLYDAIKIMKKTKNIIHNDKNLSTTAKANVKFHASVFRKNYWGINKYIYDKDSFCKSRNINYYEVKCHKEMNTNENVSTLIGYGVTKPSKIYKDVSYTIDPKLCDNKSFYIKIKNDGTTLYARYREATLEQLIKWTLQMVQVCQDLVNLNYLHLDMNPENICIDGEDNAKLCGFGGVFKKGDSPRMEGYQITKLLHQFCLSGQLKKTLPSFSTLCVNLSTLYATENDVDYSKISESFVNLSK